MKIIALLSFLIFAGCASHSITANNKSNFRSISSDAPMPIPAAPLSGSFFYKGPILLNPEGETRKEAKVYLPLQYDLQEKWPVVILLHGIGATADIQDKYLTLRYRVSSRGYILVTPEGTTTPSGTTTSDGEDFSGKQFWNATDFCCDFANTGVNDVSYLSRLIETVQQNYKVDSQRIYIFGHSNGGFMANRLACEIDDKIAAIASLAGGTFKDLESCRLKKSIPYLQIHAENDDVVSYNTQPLYSGGHPTAEQWIQKNSCKASDVQTTHKNYLSLVPGKETKTQTWNNCTSGKEVALWSIKKYNSGPNALVQHKPHTPLFKLNFTNDVLDFLFRQKLNSP